ncbi:hypothetical protein BKA62DRAFT_681281 [Auriculariales sp. MPI-PUGE-AT-0066]|nr:hypothetical protein BKA62DRAFT_681281 [Auriculariales sp. MPI-PUGE-AT-0066]
MASATTAPAHPLYSPSVGARRKNVTLPTLPASAFTSPPGTGTNEQFPIPPSPSTVRPAALVDAGVVSSLEQWKAQIGDELVAKSRGVVLVLDSVDDAAIKAAEQDSAVLAVSVPFDLAAGVPDESSLPAYIAAPPPNLAIALRTSFTDFTPQHADGVHWAVSRGHAVDIHVLADLNTEGGWESLSELITSALSSERGPSSSGKTGTIVLSNVLPAPVDMSITIVKLLTHPVYTNFQAYISTVSLFSNVYLKYSPPTWGSAVPKIGTEAGRDWKRRIKMYLGQGVEAFGDRRILFASGPSVGPDVIDSGDWYALARESLAELGLDQEAVDAIFAANAQTVYSV